MRFTPKTEDELARENLLPAGEYDFEVLEAEEATSAKGKEMIKLKLRVFGSDGSEVHVYDYLMEAMAFKLRHFCAMCGLMQRYEAGTLCARDCERRAGRVTLIVETDKSNKYPPKNSVKDYAIPKEGNPDWPNPPAQRQTAAVVSGGVTEDDTMPF